MSEIKTYTTADLTQHSSKDSLWLAVGGKVYDCTDFVDEHPGGEEVLYDEAGKDATESFDDVGHSDEAREMLNKMYIGEYEASIFNGGKTSKSATSTTPRPTPAGGSADSGRLVSWVKGWF
ncbi:hypothetical protein BG011_007607 [Mortierella polycephala]|uniref:Cytochrome b5 heme-binding domain-containing protein n=1 Tax=Mortierella polycephala TaxID=41804 RepID=A0A9P6TXI0_9FUNG|nr:hypothetical protein BG011_007607 [Mortierella polycephala]